MKARHPALLILLGILLIALLAVLGWLQYRWIGEVSRDERDRMRANVEASLAGMARDFDREVSLAFAQLQMSGDPDAARTAEQWDRWMSVAASPRIVSGVYAVERADDGRLLLRRFRREAPSFEEVAWPPQLATVREHIAKGGDQGGAPWIDPAAPAIVSAIVAFRIVGAPDAGSLTLLYGGAKALTLPLRAWCVIAFDRGVIEHEMLPQMTARYFPRGDYRLIVSARGAPRPQRYDAEQNFFAIRMDELPAAAMQLASARAATAPLTLGPGRPVTFRVIERVGRRGNVTRKLDPQWTLRAVHRSGSLEEAISRTRLRNLGISFSVLALLAVAIGFAALAAHRAHALARQQMEFVAAVSHELRTPLATICAAGDNLSSGVVATPERVQEYGAVLRREGRRLSETIEQVLEFARGQARRGRYAMQPIDVADVIERAVEATHHAVEQSRREVVVTLADNLPPIDGDAAALARAVQNLIENAVKYGRKTIETDVSAKDSTLSIRVSDRGLGVDRDDVPHLFSPFFRGASSAGAPGGGTGLGLAIVKRIAEAHGGRTSYAAREGGGASFIIELPVAKR